MQQWRTVTGLLAACLLGATPPVLAQFPSALPLALKVTGDVGGTHDPSIAFDHGIYYVFATGTAYVPHAPGLGLNPHNLVGQLPIRCSADLLAWTRCGAVFPAIPAWIQALSPATHELWAPDISFFDGLFHLYYTFSLFGKNTSGIALATSPALDPTSPQYGWQDRGLVLHSSASDDFNAIDPNLILDQKGNAWIAFGSFWSGIKLRRLDRVTGLLSSRDTRLYSLAARAHNHNPTQSPPDTNAIEAPFLFFHDGFYYLLVSWDLCCKGASSTYRTMVGRSKKITGPYKDRKGKKMLLGGGSLLLTGNALWRGPGGASLLHLPDQGLAAQDLIAFHAYRASDGRPALQLSTLTWIDGWPEAALEGSTP